LRRGGERILDALLAHLAPVGWQQINLTGDYPWDADAGLGPDGFRPLRSAAIDESPSRSETTGLADRPAWRESGPEKEPPEVRLTRPWRGVDSNF